MRKIILPVAIVTVALSTIFIACEKDKDVAVTSVSFNRASDTLGVDQTLQLVATVLPENVANKAVEWESGDLIIATVFDGLVTAISPGNVIIKAISNQDNSKFAEFALTVVKLPHPVLGDVDFKSATTWIIGEGADQQIWSDVVVAENYKKDDFDGGSKETGFIADGRQNPGYGDLFSWEAVNQYRTALCPAPWRLPDTADFIKLDKLLGGDGTGQDNSPILDEYINRWGATYGGSVGSNGFGGQGTSALYWSGTENRQETEVLPYGMAYNLAIISGEQPGVVWTPAPNPDDPSSCPPGSWYGGPNGCGSMGMVTLRTTIPAGNNGKGSGYMVRCVR